ncbi:MAG TPA: host attachment family protein, partial [Rhizorhapis sp.]|nr:host attachment family protein [Rhizorhapis sp.]
EDRKDSDIKSDAAGSSKQSMGYGRPSMDETDFHQLEEDRWAHNAAEAVNQRVLTNNFDALAIIAPPKTLGELRKKLHKEAERRLICEIPKEMTGRPIPDIEALLVGETKAEELSPF